MNFPKFAADGKLMVEISQYMSKNGIAQEKTKP